MRNKERNKEREIGAQDERERAYLRMGMDAMRECLVE